MNWSSASKEDLDAASVTRGDITDIGKPWVI